MTRRDAMSKQVDRLAGRDRLGLRQMVLLALAITILILGAVAWLWSWR
jgi:hypothetical protein